MALPVFCNLPRPRVEGLAREGGVLVELDPCDFLAQPRGIIERFNFVLQFDFRDSKPAVCAEIAADFPGVFRMLERVAVLYDDFAAGKIDKGRAPCRESSCSNSNQVMPDLGNLTVRVAYAESNVRTRMLI